MKRLAIGLGVTAFALAACQVIVGIDEVAKVPQGSVGEDGATSSTSTSSSGGQNPNDPCKRVLPPDYDAPIDPSPNLDPMWLAVQTMSLTRTSAGFDLDGTCTCDKRPLTAFDGGASCVGQNLVCDTADGGIDNNGAALFTSFSRFNANLDDDLNEDIASGKRTVMLYVKDWNGKPNDSDVKVGVFVSNGTHLDSGSSTRVKPNFDGNDGWTWQLPASRAGNEVTVEGKNGYVVNGKLVVKAAGELNIYFGIAKISFGSALIVGDLSYDADRKLPKFSGIIGGRIPRDDIFAAAGQLRTGRNDVTGEEEFACTHPLFGVIADPICQGGDIASSPLNDHKGAACDAISSALAIDAVGAKILVDEEDRLTIPENNNCVPGRSARPQGYKCN